MANEPTALAPEHAHLAITLAAEYAPPGVGVGVGVSVSVDVGVGEHATNAYLAITLVAKYASPDCDCGCVGEWVSEIDGPALNCSRL